MRPTYPRYEVRPLSNEDLAAANIMKDVLNYMAEKRAALIEEAYVTHLRESPVCFDLPKPDGKMALPIINVLLRRDNVEEHVCSRCLESLITIGPQNFRGRDGL